MTDTAAADDAPKFSLAATGKVAPFPREKFLKFLSKLKVQSKDFGLVPFRLLGSQRYILDELCKARDEGISHFLILKARQMGACHDPNMRVLTADLRWVRIGDVNVGDKLVSVDENPDRGKGRARRMRTCEVQKTVEFTDQAVEIILDDGTVLIATPQHPYLCKVRGAVHTQWRRVDKLRLGDEIRALVKPWDGEPDPESYWMGGVIDGEGSMRQKNRAGCEMCISQVDGPVLDRARRYIEDHGYVTREEVDVRQSGASKLGSKPVYRIVCSRIADLFKLMGQTRPARFIGRQWWDDKELPNSGAESCWRKVVSLRYLDQRTVVDLQTSTGTYICEGVVSHNTTFFIALDMFWAFNYKGLLGTFVLHKEEARDDWRATIEVFYQEIPGKTTIDGQPVRFKPGILHHNRNILSFNNGSRFRYLIAGTSENRKGGLGRSGASNYTHMTEAAFYGNENDLAAFTSSTSSIYPHRLFIKETTANGFNHFAEEWDEGLKSKTKRCIFVGWWRDERNQFATDHDFYQFFMPDNAITKLERERVRAVKAEYGVTITLQQIAWYRWKLEEEFHGDQSMMDQEFPWTADDAFQATGAKYFQTAHLTAAIKEARRHKFAPYRYKISNRWDEIQVVGFPDPRAELRIWEQASKFGYYVLACDPAYGSSESADRNVITVWRCFADGIEQVAEFASSSMSMYQTAWVLAHLGGFYGQNDARVILEMNGPGKAVFAELQQVARDLRQMRPTPDNYELRNCLNRMHHFCYQRIDNIGGGDMVYQWLTTEALKTMVMTRFKDGFELGRLRIRSVPMLEEMRRIINDEGHIAAEGAGNDDRVITAALAYECYNKWLRQRLIGMNMTREHSAVIEANGGESTIFRIVDNYLKRSNIRVEEPRQSR